MCYVAGTASTFKKTEWRSQGVDCLNRWVFGEKKFFVRSDGGSYINKGRFHTINVGPIMVAMPTPGQLLAGYDQRFPVLPSFPRVHTHCLYSTYISATLNLVCIVMQRTTQVYVRFLREKFSM